jgi:hypothetical protein
MLWGVKKLPQGWSPALKGAEPAELFPWVGFVTWLGRPVGWQAATSLPVFGLRWSPTSAMPQPGLDMWAVPSTIRSQVRQAIHRQGAAEAGHWYSKITSTEVFRATEHNIEWRWTDDGLQRSQL